MLRNINAFYVLGTGERLLAQYGRLLTYLNGTTGAVETVLANDCAAVYYGEPGPDAGNNLLFATGSGVSLGNAERNELHHVLWEHYSPITLVGQRLVLCHSIFSTAYQKQLAVYDVTGQRLGVLAEGDMLPQRGLLALDHRRVAGLGLSTDYLAVWDVETWQQLWQVAIPEDNGATLNVHETGSHVLMHTRQQVLYCYAGTDGELLWQYRLRPDDTSTEEFRTVLGRHNRVLFALSNGDLGCLDLATGELLGRENHIPTSIEAAALATDNVLFVMYADATLARYDVSDWLGDTGRAGLPQATGTFAAPPTAADEATLLRHLEAADWAAFRWETDAGPLLAALHAAEQRTGVGAAHHYASARLQARAAEGRPPLLKLTHRHGHRYKLRAFALRPDGRYFATGSWTGPDYNKGGELLVWDMATGRAVNSLYPVPGGVGSPFHSNCLQWSPDGNLLGLAHDTNGVSAAWPFADHYAALASFYEAGGLSSPPQWCWHPEGKALFIGCWLEDGGTLPGCIAPLPLDGATRRPAQPFEDPTEEEIKAFFSPEELAEEAEENDSDELRPPVRTFQRPGWSAQGFIFGCDHRHAYTLDVATQRLSTVVDNGELPALWSPDGQWLLRVRESEIDVLDAHGQLQRSINVGADVVGSTLAPGAPTPAIEVSVGPDGTPTLLFGRTAVQPLDQFFWHPNPQQQLLGTAVTGEYGYVAFYRNLQLLGVAHTDLRPTGWLNLHDAESLAFAPDGRQVATLASTGTVTIWELADDGVRALRSFPVLPDAQGIFLGADQRLVAIDERQFAFYDAADGRLLAHYQQRPQEDGEDTLFAPPLPAGREHDETLSRAFFPLEHQGRTHWVAALPTGQVMADAAVVPLLDEELTFTLGNRYPWPYRWAEPQVVTALPDLA